MPTPVVFTLAAVGRHRLPLLPDLNGEKVGMRGGGNY